MKEIKKMLRNSKAWKIVRWRTVSSIFIQKCFKYVFRIPGIQATYLISFKASFYLLWFVIIQQNIDNAVWD